MARYIPLVGLPRPNGKVGQENTALSFDGFGACLLIPYQEALNNLGDEFTLEAWIYLAGYGSDNFPTIIGNDYEASYWFGVAGSEQHLRFYVNGRPPIDSHLQVSLKHWHHVVVTYNDESVRFYVDGKDDDPLHSPRGPLRSNVGQVLGVGGDPGTHGSDTKLYGFEGQIAGAGIWNYVLSPEEVQVQYQKQLQ